MNLICMQRPQACALHSVLPLVRHTNGGSQTSTLHLRAFLSDGLFPCGLPSPNCPSEQNVFMNRFQDLEYLSSGLEGRSSNPIALLLDTLTHPDADIGMEVPSILEWRHLPDKAIDHVVLGKMPVGGAWQVTLLDCLIHSLVHSGSMTSSWLSFFVWCWKNDK